MKKLALILAFMIIPCTAFGLEMLTDNTLDTITGQDGVSISADDIQLFLNVDLFAYADADGYDLHNGCSATGCGNGAMIAVSNFQMDVININAIAITSTGGVGVNSRYTTSYSATTHNLPLQSTSCGIPLFYNYASTAPFESCIGTCLLNYLNQQTGDTNDATKGLDNYTATGVFTYKGTDLIFTNTTKFIPQALSIDLTDNLPLFGQSYTYLLSDTSSTIKVQGVLITLPTLEIYIQDINFTVAMHPLDCDTSVMNGGNFLGTRTGTSNRFGEFIIQGVTFSILSGWVEISPH